MATFDSNGYSIAFDDIGPREARRPIVLLHGFSSNRNENWRRLGWYGALERKGMRAIAMDWRGHGESAKPHDPAAYTRDAMVGDVFALLDHLNVEVANIMGFSMGARLALAAALSKPERLRDLVLGGIGGRIFDPPPSGNLMAEAMEAEDPQSISDPLIRSFRHFADEQSEDRMALAACTRTVAMPITRADVAQLHVPTLVVAGARDSLAGDPEDLARSIPDARAITLPGCDHFSAIPHGLFKAAVFDFLDGTLE